MVMREGEGVSGRRAVCMTIAWQCEPCIRRGEGSPPEKISVLISVPIPMRSRHSQSVNDAAAAASNLHSIILRANHNSCAIYRHGDQHNADLGRGETRRSIGTEIRPPALPPPPSPRIGFMNLVEKFSLYKDDDTTTLSMVMRRD